MTRAPKPGPIKYKGSYVGVGVGPVNQKGTIYTETQLRDAGRNMARGLNDDDLEIFMSNVRYKGIHQPEREGNWEWCPLKQFSGYCAGCTHIFIVSNLPLTPQGKGD